MDSTGCYPKLIAVIFIYQLVMKRLTKIIVLAVAITGRCTLHDKSSTCVLTKRRVGEGRTRSPHGVCAASACALQWSFIVHGTPSQPRSRCRRRRAACPASQFETLYNVACQPLILLPVTYQRSLFVALEACHVLRTTLSSCKWARGHTVLTQQE